MKKITLIILIAGFFLLGPWLIPQHTYARSVPPEVFWLDLGEAESGNTTEASGTSTFVIHAGQLLQTPDSGSMVSSDSGVSAIKGLSTIGLSGVSTPYIILQISGITVSIGQQSAGGDYSGTTVTVYGKKAIIDSADSYNGAKRDTLIDGMALSGNTPYLVVWEPGWCDVVWFEMLSGITVVDNVKIKVIVMRQ